MPDQIQINFDLTGEESRVLAAVSAHRGRENAVLGGVLAAVAGVDYKRLREVIAHLVNNHGCLIASCPRGYFIPVTVPEIAEATRSLRHRGIMILMRASRLQKASLEDIFNQARMEFGEGEE
ncbi:MAG: hypothetical protein M0Z52_03915 [Actinomycetota bacterium]|nr:hypothetical protein [Actinomycetota bacterium]